MDDQHERFIRIDGWIASQAITSNESDTDDMSRVAERAGTVWA